MFIVLLKFSENKSKAPDFMSAHNKWLMAGFEDELFVLAGSLQPGKGGALISALKNREDIESVIEKDPFVKEKIVEPEIIEITPAKAIDALSFLIEG